MIGLESKMLVRVWAQCLVSLEKPHARPLPHRGELREQQAGHPDWGKHLAGSTWTETYWATSTRTTEVWRSAGPGSCQWEYRLATFNIIIKNCHEPPTPSHLSESEAARRRNVRPSCIWTLYMGLCSSWNTTITISVSEASSATYLILRGREKNIQTGGQTTIVKNSRISFRLFPVQLRPPRQSSLRYDWTAALETTVFWSHSIRTSRNVTFRRSIACRTFPVEWAV